MKITFKDALSTKEWIHRELMNSLTGDIIEKAMEDEFYDVKLLVNGVELEPKFYNDILNNIESYIKNQAEQIIETKLSKIKSKLAKLDEIVDDSINNISDQLNLILTE